LTSVPDKPPSTRSRGEKPPPEPPLPIAPLAPDDYEEVAKLWKACEGLSRIETRDEYERFISRNPELSLKAVSPDGKLAAGIMVGYDGRRGYMYHLGVAPEFRRRGVASQMVKRSLELLRTLGMRRCTIFLFSDNNLAKKFWAAMGFRPRPELRSMSFELIEDEPS
jgi:N-acetylglutamate synthase